MFRTVVFSLIALSLGACSPAVKDAKQALEDSLPITKEIEYRNLETFTGGVVCGEYSAFVSYKLPKADYAPFLVVSGKLYNPPSEMDQALFCSEDPASVLLNKTGIGPYTAQNKVLARITADLSSMTEAIEAFYSDNHKFPAGAQGLDVLVSKPESGRPLPRYREGGYLDAIPLDPWGQPYIYDEEQWGRTKGKYSLTTLGADGTKGGAGENADVSTDALKYLRHIATILGQQ